jgi:hypothetical protein
MLSIFFKLKIVVNIIANILNIIIMSMKLNNSNKYG